MEYVKTFESFKLEEEKTVIPFFKKNGIEVESYYSRSTWSTYLILKYNNNKIDFRLGHDKLELNKINGRKINTNHNFKSLNAVVKFVKSYTKPEKIKTYLYMCYKGIRSKAIMGSKEGVVHFKELPFEPVIRINASQGACQYILDNYAKNAFDILKDFFKTRYLTPKGNFKLTDAYISEEKKHCDLDLTLDEAIKHLKIQIPKEILDSSKLKNAIQIGMFNE